MKLKIRECNLDDLYTLQNLSLETFNLTFAPLNTEENMKAYTDYAYETEKLKRELSDCNSEFYFIYEDEKLLGYMKVNDTQAQTELKDRKALELERIYIIEEAQGKGVSKVLLDKAIEIAKEKGKSYIWLGVWEHNERAKAFYKKHGFYRFSQHTFVMGDDPQTDLLMRKDLD